MLSNVLKILFIQSAKLQKQLIRIPNVLHCVSCEKNVKSKQISLKFTFGMTIIEMENNMSKLNNQNPTI